MFKENEVNKVVLNLTSSLAFDVANNKQQLMFEFLKLLEFPFAR